MQRQFRALIPPGSRSNIEPTLPGGARMLSRKLLLAACLACTLSVAAAAGNSEPVPTTARKVVLEKKDSGYGYKVIQAPVPKPGAGQLLVRMRAVALNRGDLELLDYKGRHDFSGMVPASDGAGEVVAVGAGTRPFRIGDRVTSLYFPHWADGAPSAEKMKSSTGADIDGVLADYVVLDATAVAPIPSGWSFVDAATLPTAGLTAWSAVIVEGRAGPKKVVLVQGTGGVSTF